MANEITLPEKVSTLSNFLNYYDAGNIGRRGSRHNNITTIKFDSSNPNKQFAKYDDSEWLGPLAVALNKCGIDCKNTGHYDLNMSRAVEEFQRRFLQEQVKLDLCHYGVLDNLTISHIVSYAQEGCPDYIDPDTGEYVGRKPTESASDTDKSNPHYNPFFDSSNDKQFRQNHKNIKIILGNSGIIKEIHDVIMRSVGVEVDTSGNPISETYEFIARDITETDESQDADNYTGNNGVAPSDIQYKFNFKR